jgi:uncharacterized protein YaeQ
MALTSTIVRFTLHVSDVDRAVYETLDLRLAQHPSEGDDRLVARALAAALFHEEGLEAGRGISSADEPALWSHDLTGRLLLWVDVGVPTPERLHLASKKAERVAVLCHKGAEALERALAGARIHKSEELALLALEPGFAATLAERLQRNNEWSVLRSEDSLSVSLGSETIEATITQVRLGE